MEILKKEKEKKGRLMDILGHVIIGLINISSHVVTWPSYYYWLGLISF